jgi:hypothetical protein
MLKLGLAPGTRAKERHNDSATVAMEFQREDLSM